MATKFFYMDEQYVDHQTHRKGQAPKRRQCTSLTGVLIPTDIHGIFRKRFYQEVANALDIKANIIPQMPVIHASNLFPQADDAVKFVFLENIVALASELKFRIYRVGYFETKEMLSNFKDRKGILGMCFLGLLFCLEGELAISEIWPVMESDNSAEQDRLFAGQVQNIDYFTTLIGNQAMTVKNGNLGELHYSTKRSAYGTVTDCICYLLDARFLKTLGPVESPFKQRLAEIASGLEPLIAFDEIIELKFEKPPAGYVGNGPVRFIFPITPED